MGSGASYVGSGGCDLWGEVAAGSGSNDLWGVVATRGSIRSNSVMEWHQPQFLLSIGPWPNY